MRWYIFEMAKERKSPQLKKELEYTRDRFTFGWHSSRMFPRTWKRKKAHANREYRRKSQAVLTRVKPEVSAHDVESIGDDLTSARFRKSISRKRLRKVGTVTIGQKIKKKLENREETAGRRVKSRQQDDRRAASAIAILSRLEGDALIDVARRAEMLCGPRQARELGRVLQSSDPVDHALYFLYLVMVGSAFELRALRRQPELNTALRNWAEKAGRILGRDQRAAASKREQKQAARKKNSKRYIP